MVQSGEASSVNDDNKTRSHLSTHTPIHIYENIMYVDDVSGDYPYSVSSSSDTNGIESTNDFNEPLRRIISKHRRNCWKHLDYIELLIDDKSQQFSNKKYYILQNEMKIRERISETKDEIQKLKDSVYNQTIEQVRIFDTLKVVYIVIIWAIFAFVSIFCCWDNGNVCYNWLNNINAIRFNF